jgi:hypothetical protein
MLTLSVDESGDFSSQGKASVVLGLLGRSTPLNGFGREVENAIRDAIPWIRRPVHAIDLRLPMLHVAYFEPWLDHETSRGKLAAWLRAVTPGVTVQKLDAHRRALAEWLEHSGLHARWTRRNLIPRNVTVRSRGGYRFAAPVGSLGAVYRNRPVQRRVSVCCAGG